MKRFSRILLGGVLFISGTMFAMEQQGLIFNDKSGWFEAIAGSFTIKVEDAGGQEVMSIHGQIKDRVNEQGRTVNVNQSNKQPLTNQMLTDIMNKIFEPFDKQLNNYSLKITIQGNQQLANFLRKNKRKYSTRELPQEITVPTFSRFVILRPERKQ